jgi:hypothetical protein
MDPPHFPPPLPASPPLCHPEPCLASRHWATMDHHSCASPSPRHHPKLRTDATSPLDHPAGALNCLSAPPPPLPATRIALPLAAQFRWALPLPTPKIQPPLVAGLLPGHSTANHRPLADRILLASHRRRWGRRPPLVLPWAESPRRAEHCSSRPYE